MAESNTTRFGVRQWSADADTVDRTEFNNSFAAIEAKGAIFLEGLRAARPAAGLTGRFYKVKGETAGNAYLNGQVFYDDGAVWTPVGSNVEDAVMRSSAAGNIPLIAKGFAGQTAKLQEWRTSADVVVASMDIAGKLTVSAMAVSGALTFNGAQTITGLLTASGGITTTTVQTSGDVTAARIRSTAQRADGAYKTELNQDGTARVDGLIPPGTIVMTAATTAPTGWLLCQGQAISRTTYVDLYNVIGVQHGAGDGSTTFNVPDLRDRTVIGASGTKALASTGGAATIVLAEANLPPHTHAIDHNHASFNTAAGGAHDHSTFTNNADGSSTVYLRQANNDGGAADSTHVGVSGAHNHAVDVPNFTGASGAGSGTAAAVGILPPYRALNFLIKV